MQKIAKSNTKQGKIINFDFLDKFLHSKLCKITTKKDNSRVNESYPFGAYYLFMSITEPTTYWCN